MSRMVSLIVLVVILVAIAIVFFDVMSGFILPIFMAILLVVMFRPLHLWFIKRCKSHVRVAAGLTTISIMFIVLIPVAFLVWQATSQAVAVYGRAEDAAKKEVAVDDVKDPKPDAGVRENAHDKTESQKTADEQVAEVITRAVVGVSTSIHEKFPRLTEYTLEDVRPTIKRSVVPKLKSWLAPLAVSTTQYAIRFVIGLCIMMVALYYFLADGPAMLDSMMRLSPLDTYYVKQLIEEFDNISRAVVLATLVSAVAQGVLAGIGYYFAGLGSVFLLMFLTMLLAMIPFVGATGIWLPACLWMFYNGQIGAAIGLFIYGTLVVSLVDNLLKPFILHGATNLHPLLALLSVLGGVEALGLIGIFVGPMVVVFLQALLIMVQKELERLKTREDTTPAAAVGTAKA